MFVPSSTPHSLGLLLADSQEGHRIREHSLITPGPLSPPVSLLHLLILLELLAFHSPASRAGPLRCLLLRAPQARGGGGGSLLASFLVLQLNDTSQLFCFVFWGPLQLC